MKKLTAIMTAAIFSLAMLFQTVLAGVDYSGSVEVPNGIDMGSNISVWSTYMFFTGNSGITVVDMQKKSVEGTWSFGNGEIPGVADFRPVETVVNDDYIITSNAKSIAVFKNAKGFSDEIPELVCRITKDYSQSESFDSVRKMMIIDDILYIFERAKDGEALVIKLPLGSIDNTAYEEEETKLISAIPNSENASLGFCDYMWSKIKTDEENAYIGLYNDEDTAPYKTLTLKAVNLETLENAECTLISNTVSGLYARISGAADTEKLMDSEISMIGNEKIAVKLGDLTEADYAEVTLSDSSAEVRIKPENIVALASIFGCSTLDIQSNKVVFTLDYEGKTVSFTYNENDDIYENGSIAIKDEYVFVHTNSASAANKLITVKNDNEGLSLISSRPATNAQGGTGANDIICIDDVLVALYRNSDFMAITYDISKPASIPYNSVANIQLKGTIKTGDYTNIVKWGNGYYYLATGTNGVGVIMTNGTERTAEVSYSDGRMPIKLYGFGVDGEEVDITIDNQKTVKTVVSNGLWSYDIHVLNPGDHTFEVKNGRSKTLTVQTTAEAPVDIKAECDGVDVKITLTNNTDRYGKMFRSNKFYIYSGVYAKNGELVWIDKGVVNNPPFGERYEYTPWLLAEFNAGDFVEILVTDENGSPVTAPVYVRGANEAEYKELPNIYGDMGDFTVKADKIDYANRKLTIKGNIETDCSRIVYLEFGGDVVMGNVRAVETDDDGNFEFVYEYGPDYQSKEVTYEITARALGGDAENFAKVSYTVMYKADFENALSYIKENIKSGSEMAEYLKLNSNFAQTIGVDFENEDYAALGDKDKTALMDDVLKALQGGSENVARIFEEGAKKLRTEAREAQAIAALKADTTTKATLTGILEEYNDVFKISDSLWKEYTSNKNIQTVNKYFLEYNITDVNQVSEKLKKSINAANNSSLGGGGTGGKVNPGGGIGSKIDIDIDIANGNKVNTFDKYFDDIEQSYWAAEAINSLAQKNIVNGTGERTFSPNNSVTREEFVKMLVSALGLYDSSAKTEFGDVSVGHWAYRFIASAQKCGLTNGMDGNRFGIGQTITREEMAVMAYRAIQISGQTVNTGNVNFADRNEISNYAAEAVGAMSNAGILNGVGDNMFAPKGICSRAMAAKVIYEIIN